MNMTSVKNKIKFMNRKYNKQNYNSKKKNLLEINNKKQNNNYIMMMIKIRMKMKMNRNRNITIMTINKMEQPKIMRKSNKTQKNIQNELDKYI